ncbi:MAG TPA: type II toxin-antitoxin system ParD family antitoxin [Rhizobiaceae bacterium]|nr:type II toxin-antitoxin system ParD family antitoxin [Rhizobiaceae bacterium]
MGKNTSVVIGERQQAFLRRQIEAGRFGSASEAVREGLALLEERESRIEELRKAIDEGDASGVYGEIDMCEFLAGKGAARTPK